MCGDSPTKRQQSVLFHNPWSLQLALSIISDSGPYQSYQQIKKINNKVMVYPPHSIPIVQINAYLLKLDFHFMYLGSTLTSDWKMNNSNKTTSACHNKYLEVSTGLHCSTCLKPSIWSRNIDHRCHIAKLVTFHSWYLQNKSSLRSCSWPKTSAWHCMTSSEINLTHL